MEKELINYIKESKEKGFSDEDIKKALLDAGWEEKDIEEAIDFTLQKPKLSKKFPLKSVLAGIIIALIIGLIGLGVYLYLEEYRQPAEEAGEEKGEQKEEAEDIYKDRETYRNEEFGFEIKYPSEYKVITIPIPEFGEETMELAPVHMKKFFVVQGISLDLLGSEVTI